MNDLDISVTKVLSWTLWVVGTALCAIHALTGGRIAVAGLGVVAVAGGATLTVRSYFVGLHCRERSAFELGRDSVRAVR